MFEDFSELNVVFLHYLYKTILSFNDIDCDKLVGFPIELLAN